MSEENLVVPGRVKLSLSKLGLSESEIKAYLVLLEQGALTAIDVSRRANIPYSKVYDILKKLEEKGWIYSNEGRPALFSARHPKEAIDVWRSKREAEMRFYENIALEELGKLIPALVKEKPDVWIVRGIESVVDSVVEAVNSCRNELLLVLPREMENYLSRIVEPLRAAILRGADVAVLTPSAGLAKEIGEELPSVRLKVKDGMFGGGLICDASRVVLLLGEKSKGEPYIAIWADHPGLAVFAKSYFDFLWSQASPVEV